MEKEECVRYKTATWTLWIVQRWLIVSLCFLSYSSSAANLHPDIAVLIRYWVHQLVISFRRVFRREPVEPRRGRQITWSCIIGGFEVPDMGVGNLGPLC